MRRIVIVGNGVAGVSAALAAREHDRHAEVTILGSEPYLAYHRPRLTYVLGKQTDIGLFLLHDRKWYEDRNIRVLTGAVVESGTESCVVTGDGTTYAYDSLVIATGGLSNIPPLPGGDRDGVMALRTYDDLKQIEGYAASIDHVAVIGGGLLGLEAAWAFRQWGKQVTVLERGTGLLRNQLDENGMRLLGELVAAKGIEVLYGAETQEITGDKRVSGINLKDGRRISPSLVLLSTGVRPNTTLAKAMGLNVARGVVVTDRMKSGGSVYAAGDCAEYNGKIPGTWPVAQEQGRIAGINAVGGDEAYRELVPSNTTMVMGVTVFSIGDVGRVSGPYKILQESDGHDSYMSFYLKDDVLVGSVLIGPPARKAPKVKALVDSRALTGQQLLATTAPEFLSTI